MIQWRANGLVIALSLLGAGGACAQNTRSQLGLVSQSIAGTRVEIVYRRPVARGRQLFGSLVPWGRIWTPSADTAARFTTTGPLQVNGSNLPAGSYSVWAIPDSSSWTIVFNGVAESFHLRYPEGRDVLRVRATPASGEHVETLMFAFPVVDADSARLELRWGTTVVPLSIHAKP
jgi:Protein of unknown function (DUF2911)